MKIAIAISSYKQEPDLLNRQQMCLESLRRVKNKFPEVDLFNVQYVDEDINYDDFTPLKVLTKTSYEILLDYFDHHGLVDLYNEKFDPYMEDIKTTRIPSVKQILDSVKDLEDYTHILFVNDDIVVSDRLIKTIKDNPDYDCYPASRLHLFDFDDIDGDFTPEAYSVHGFDAYCFNREWWINNRNNFHDLLVGKPYWDTHFFALCQLLGKTLTLNKLPAVLFHPEHESTSCTSNDILSQYNEDIFSRDLVCKQLWFRYVYDVLLKRPEVNNIKWYQPFPNEVELERKMFKDTMSAGVEPFECKVLDRELKQPAKEKEFDVFLACAPKDNIKLKYMLRGLIQNVDGIKDIHICSPKPIPKFEADTNIYYHLDKEVLPDVDPLKWKFRPNWCFQQFLKLFQTVTSTDYYLTLDIDSVINRPMKFFEDDHPIWYTGWRQNHLPYFLFNKYMLELDKVVDHTFICDMNFFNKTIINEMMSMYNFTPSSFAEKSYNIMTQGCHIGEPELYGNFAEKYYPGLYKYKPAKQYHFGKDHSNDPSAVPWTEQEIQELLKDKEDYDMIQMHSWCAGFENHWQ